MQHLITPAQELDQSAVQCNLGFLEDEGDDRFFKFGQRVVSKSEFVRRPSDIDANTPLPTEGLLSKLVKLSAEKER